MFRNQKFFFDSSRINNFPHKPASYILLLMFKRVGVLFLIILILYIANAFLFPFPKKNVPEGFRPLYGTSYSFEQAGWYGYDGRAEFVKLLDEVKFDWVRLPFFWDQMVDGNGEFNKNFEDLEFAIEEAEKRDVKVIIALGLKTPYYPEYHLPKKIAAQMKFGEKIGAGHPVADDLIAIDREIVSRLSKHKNIAYWQIENEPYLANVNNWKIERSLILEEIKAVKGADEFKRPIILNHVGPPVFDREWKSLASLLGSGDVFGVNAYFKTQGINLFAFSIFSRDVNVPWPRFLIWPVQSWYVFSPNFESLNKQFESAGHDLWALEAQAEPYIRNLDDAKRNYGAFGVEDVAKVDEYLKSVRVKSVGFWGANYWIYREKLGDESWMDAVKKVVN